MENETISLIIPTRKRIPAIKELLKTIEDNTKYPDRLEVCIYLDEDDIDTINSIKQLEKYSFHVKYWIGKEGEHKKNMCGWNVALDKIATGTIIALFADDFRIRSKHFDDIVYKTFDKFPDKIACVYGDDGFVSKNLKIATFHFLHRNWINALPYWLPPYYSVDYVDTHIGDVADIIQRKIYVDELKIEHMHPICGKGKWDKEHYDKIVFEKSTETNKKIYYTKENIEERHKHADILRKLIR
jgi:hypothetical protein